MENTIALQPSRCRDIFLCAETPHYATMTIRPLFESCLKGLKMNISKTMVMIEDKRTTN